MGGEDGREIGWTDPKPDFARVVLLGPPQLQRDCIEAILVDLPRTTVETRSDLREDDGGPPPDLVVLQDHALESEIWLAARIAEVTLRWPAVPMLVLAPAWGTQRLCLDSGVRACLPATASPELLGDVARLIQNGFAVYAADVLDSVRARVGGDRTDASSPAALLTARQFQILRLLARGETSRSIAGHLRIGETTVRAHVRAILRRLGLTGRNQSTADTM